SCLTKIVFFYFFFQAEDGIRDRNVTGVQTCALPISIGTMVAFLLYLFQIIMPMTMFAMFFTELNKALGATERIIKILDMDDEPNAGTLSEDTVNFNSLEFENVSFGYIEDTPVLENISFRAEPNQKVAFVGPSGSGKSTIFSLIERYYEIDSGRILIDGSDITDIPLY